MKKIYSVLIVAVLVCIGIAFAQTGDLDSVVRPAPLWPELYEDILDLQSNVGTYTEGEDVATRLDDIEEDIGTYAEGEDLATDVATLQDYVGDYAEGEGLATDVVDLTPVAGETYDADEDFTDDAATVADNVAYVYVNITDSADDNVLTLPSGAENLGKDLILYVNSTYSGGTLDVVMADGVTAEEVENGKYHFNCIGTATWTEVGGCQAIQELLGVDMPATKDAAWVLANATYTIPDKTAALSIASTSTDANNCVLTLPAGAECVGDTCAVIVSCTGVGTPDTIDIVVNGSLTMTDVANGYYGFSCIQEGYWTRTILPQSTGAEADYGPGASTGTGDISAYDETTFKAVLQILENAGLLSDDTTT